MQFLNHCVQTLIRSDVLPQFLEVVNSLSTSTYHALDVTQIVEIVLRLASLQT